MPVSKYVLIGGAQSDHDALINSALAFKSASPTSFNYIFGCTTSGYNPNAAQAAWINDSSPPWVSDGVTGGGTLVDAKTKWLLLGFQSDPDYNNFLNLNQATLQNCLSVTLPSVAP